MKTVIGIDISKNFVDAAFLFPDGQCAVHHFDSNNAKTASEILNTIGMLPKELNIVIECTGTYHLNLALAFYKAGCEVYTINPLSAKRYGQMKQLRAKTDRLDAKTIAEFGQTQNLRAWKPLPPQQEQLKQIVKALEDIKKLKTTISNRLEALSKNPEQNACVRDSLEETLMLFQKQIQSLQKEAVRLAQSVNQRTYSLLQSIPGVGPILASALIAQFGNFEDFSNANAVVASVGLNPAPYSSGSSVRGRSSISKRGHGYLRRILYMAALSAAKSNPMCQALYIRLLERHPSKKKALIAVAHKLLRQAYGIVKSDRPFETQYLEKLASKT